MGTLMSPPWPVTGIALLFFKLSLLVHALVHAWHLYKKDGILKFSVFSIYFPKAVHYSEQVFSESFVEIRTKFSTDPSFNTQDRLDFFLFTLPMLQKYFIKRNIIYLFGTG
jgi:hypothetical protein